MTAAGDVANGRSTAGRLTNSVAEIFTPFTSFYFIYQCLRLIVNKALIFHAKTGCGMKGYHSEFHPTKLNSFGGERSCAINSKCSKETSEDFCICKLLNNQGKKIQVLNVRQVLG